mmetsp:Transcript_10996/g.11039  ORF Transcript_10996/g.11039 Transcript_10996/m.11039 type:complete len:101 (-) Transcript_10996:283-585(-)
MSNLPSESDPSKPRNSPVQSRNQDQFSAPSRPGNQHPNQAGQNPSPAPVPNHSQSMADMIQITIASVRELGFQRYRTNQSEKKFSIMFAITNQGQSTGER